MASGGETELIEISDDEGGETQMPPTDGNGNVQRPLSAFRIESVRSLSNHSAARSVTTTPGADDLSSADVGISSVTFSQGSQPHYPLPQPLLVTDKDQPNSVVGDFTRRINAGKEIACIMCNERVKERLLLKHICEVHFWTYRPYKCGECEYRTGNPDVLISAHLFETNHRDGVDNHTLCYEKNENTEFIIQMVFRHCLEAHGNDDSAKEAIINRILGVTAQLRKHRRGKIENPRTDTPDSTNASLYDDISDDDENNNASPLPPPPSSMTMIPPPPPLPCDSDTDPVDNSIVSSTTTVNNDQQQPCKRTREDEVILVAATSSFQSPRPPQPPAHPKRPPSYHRARKTIARAPRTTPTTTRRPSGSKSPPLDIDQPPKSPDTSTSVSGADQNQIRSPNNNPDDDDYGCTSTNSASFSSSSSPPVLTPEVYCWPTTTTTSECPPEYPTGGGPVDGSTTTMTSTTATLPSLTAAVTTTTTTTTTPSSTNKGAAQATATPPPAAIVVKLQMLACDFCNAMLQNVLHWKDHNIKKHAAGYIPYRCCNNGGEDDGCDFATWRKGHMREHVLTAHPQRDKQIQQASLVPLKVNEEQRSQLLKVINSFNQRNINCVELKRLLCTDNA